MSSDRAEIAIVVLVLLASGSVLTAPVAGRAGAEGVANLLAILAAACGVGAFAVAGAVTLSAGRRAREDRRGGDGSAGSGGREGR